MNALQAENSALRSFLIALPCVPLLLVSGLASGAPPAAGASQATKDTTSDAPPTAAESAGIPVAPFKPLLPDASPSSVLPCPPKTRQVADDAILVCRAGAAPGDIPAKQGPSLWFHKNGKLRAQGQYVDNRRTGHWWNFRDDGTMDYEEDWVLGKPDGLYVSYYPDGKRMSEQHHKAGKEHGIAKYWDRDGKLVSITSYVAGRSVERKYFPVR